MNKKRCIKFIEYTPKIIPMTLIEKDIFMNLKTIDDDKELKSLLKYEKALNSLVKTIG